MKKVFRNVAVIGLLGLATVSCMKEDIVTTGSVVTVEPVHYTVGDSHGIENVYGDEEWDNFLRRMLALAREGYVVTFSIGAPSTNASKDVVTYSTRSEEEAIAWAKNMTSQGYTVSIDFDQNTGFYNCTAIK